MSNRREILTNFLAQNRHRIVAWLRSENVEHANIDDLVQEVGRRAFKYEHAFDPAQSPGGWLWRITKNVATDHHDCAAGKHEVHDDAALERQAAPSDPEQDFMDREVDHIVREIIADLPKERRALVEARFIDNLSVKEIAIAFDLPLSTVKDRLAGTLKVCRRALVRKGVDDSRGALILPLVEQSLRNGGENARQSVAAKIAAASVFSAAAAGLIVYLLMRGASGLSPVAVTLNVGLGAQASAESVAIATYAATSPAEPKPTPVCPAPPPFTPPPPCPAHPAIDASYRHRARLAAAEAEEALFNDARETIEPPAKDQAGVLFATEVRDRHIGGPGGPRAVELSAAP